MSTHACAPGFLVPDPELILVLHWVKVQRDSFMSVSSKGRGAVDRVANTNQTQTLTAKEHALLRCFRICLHYFRKPGKL